MYRVQLHRGVGCDVRARSCVKETLMLRIYQGKTAFAWHFLNEYAPYKIHYVPLKYHAECHYMKNYFFSNSLNSSTSYEVTYHVIDNNRGHIKCVYISSKYLAISTYVHSHISSESYQYNYDDRVSLRCYWNFKMSRVTHVVYGKKFTTIIIEILPRVTASIFDSWYHSNESIRRSKSILRA